MLGSELAKVSWFKWGSKEALVVDESIITEAVLTIITPDFPRLRFAIDIAKEAHAGVYRDKGGESKVPYFIHCAATTVGIWMSMLENGIGDEQLEDEKIRTQVEDTLCTTMVHDVLEDSDKKYARIILNKLGIAVLRGASVLTKRGEPWYLTLDRETRKILENDRIECAQAMEGNIKLVDRIHNLHTWPENDGFAYGKDAGLLAETKEMVGHLPPAILLMPNLAAMLVGRVTEMEQMAPKV